MTIYSSETITAKARQVVDARSEMQAEAEIPDEPIVEEVRPQEHNGGSSRYLIRI